MARLDALYPAAAEKVMVMPKLPTPRFPEAASVRNNTSARKFYGERLIAEYEVAGSTDRLGVVDKLFPHSRYDSMLLASNDDIRTATTELAAATIDAIFSLGHRFVRYLSDPTTTERFGLHGAEVHLCYNFDRDTIDRENAMFYDKRFHLHLNCWPGRDLEAVSGLPYRDLDDRLLRLRLIDPIAFLAPRVIRDKLGPTVAGHRVIVDPAEIPQAPVGLALQLPGWSALSDGTVPAIVRTLHEAASAAYAEVRSAFTGGQLVARPRTRPPLLSSTDIRKRLGRYRWLSSDTRAELLRLASLLDSLDESEVAARCDHPARATTGLALDGLDYSVGIFCRQAHSTSYPLLDAPEIVLVMQCRLFSDVGGAGIPPLRGVSAVRLDRRSGTVMTEEEIKQRSAFRDGYLEFGPGEAAARGVLSRVAP
ncbi:hypothetical protein [Micromonospora sp. LOL_021]|uniref:hypothetical protein n=1 Tax=Micromonospora sp. LOL_021 TaxID=3345417 RepID=UPI003A8563FC